jgi:hypothetical protein
MSKNNLFELGDVEIFRTGTWNGDKYVESDLDDIVDAFAKQGFQVPIKLGHKEESGDKAFGWVKSLRRSGQTLIADFMDLPADVYQAIKSRSFDSVSSEIFFNLKRGTDTFRRALKAVALLGAEIPAVAGLKPLRESFTLPDDIVGESIFLYSLNREDFSMNDTELKQQLEDSTKMIATLTADLAAAKLATNKDDTSPEFKKLQSAHDETIKQLQALQDQARVNAVDKVLETCKVPSYREFIRPLAELCQGGTVAKEYTIGDKQVSPVELTAALIGKINSDAELLFKHTSGTKTDLESGDAMDIPADEVDRLTNEYLKENKTDDYQVALFAVLKANPELAIRYNAAE